MVEVNGAYKHGRFEKNIGRKVCVYCHTLKFLPCKMAGSLPMANYIDPCYSSGHKTKHHAGKL